MHIATCVFFAVSLHMNVLVLTYNKILVIYYTAKNTYLVKMITSAWLLQFQGSLNSVTRYTHAHHVLHAEHVEMAKLEV